MDVNGSQSAASRRVASVIARQGREEGDGSLRGAARYCYGERIRQTMANGNVNSALLENAGEI